jgi:hypothetical protein
MKKFLILLIACAVSTSFALASTTTCLLPNAPYSAYLGGFSCVSGNLMFSDFQYSAPAGSPTAEQVQVTPILTDGNEGFQFNANWSGNMDSLIVFTITALHGSITDLHLSFNGLAAGEGSSANVSERFCLGGDLATCGNPSGIAGSLSVTNPPAKFNDAVFFAGVSHIQVSKDISVFAGPNGSAAISQVINTFSQPIPEPLSLALFGTGLVALGLMRKRAKK